METQNKKNSLAIASLVLGILGFLTAIFVVGIFLDIIAIILGIISIKKQNRDKGLSIAGIIIGGISILLIIVILVLPTESTETAVPIETAESAAYETTEIESVPSESNNILLNAALSEADVLNGSKTEVIGQRAYITIRKDELTGITEEDFIEFVDSCVDGSGYNWVSIICEDGTGIQFAGSAKEIAEYGKLNEEGGIDELVGNIVLRSGTYEYTEH